MDNQLTVGNFANHKAFLQFAVLILVLWLLQTFVGEKFTLGLVGLILLSVVVVNGQKIAGFMKGASDFLYN
jgi:hypothetical protein